MPARISPVERPERRSSAIALRIPDGVWTSSPGQLLAGGQRRLVQRQQQGGPVLHGTRRDCLAEIGDSVLNRSGNRLVQRVQRLFGDAVEVVVIAVHQFDDDRLLGVEVVVQAAGEDGRLVGYLGERRLEPGGREESGCGLKDLFSAGAPGEGIRFVW